MSRKIAEVKVDAGEGRAKQARAAAITQEMQDEDRGPEALEPGGPGASMTMKRRGRLTLQGRRGAREVRRLVLYVTPETAQRAFDRAARAGMTLSDWADEALDRLIAAEEEAEA